MKRRCLHEISPGGIPTLARSGSCRTCKHLIATFAKNILKIVSTSQVSDFLEQLVITNIWTITIFSFLPFKPILFVIRVVPERYEKFAVILLECDRGQVVSELSKGARTSCHAVDCRRRVLSVMQRVGKPVPLFSSPEDRPQLADGTPNNSQCDRREQDAPATFCLSRAQEVSYPIGKR
jgi:hypothetical protein